MPIAVLLFFVLISPHTAAGDGGAILTGTQHELKPTSPVSHFNRGVEFGYAIALDHDVLVVGAPSEDSSDNDEERNTGAVYVFQRQGSTWVETQKIRAPVQSPFEEFGASVDVALGDEGTDYLIVGAPGYGSIYGQVYFFRRDDNGPWTLETSLGLNDPDTSDRLGQSVAIDYFVPPASQTNEPVFIAAATAPYNASNEQGHHWNGSLSIYQRAGNPLTWGETHEFFGQDGDILGVSMSMENKDVIVGVNRLDTAGFSTGGGVSYTQGGFDGTAYNYAKGSEFVASDPFENRRFGHSTAIASDPDASDIPMALGDPNRTEVAGFEGIVYIYDLAVSAGSIVTEETKIFAPVAQLEGHFGQDMDFSGDLLAIGAPGIGPDGTVFLFEKGTTLQQWNLLGSISIVDTPPDGDCRGGTSVEMEGKILVAGCPGKLVQDDAVYVFDDAPMFKDGFEN